jgi:hypothetical protein
MGYSEDIAKLAAHVQTLTAIVTKSIGRCGRIDEADWEELKKLPNRLAKLQKEPQGKTGLDEIPPPPPPPPKRQVAYEEGRRAAWTRLLKTVLCQLGYEDPAAKRAAWVAEREEAVATLRGVCAEHGDNEWPVNLHLADVISKHLACHIDEFKATKGQEASP